MAHGNGGGRGAFQLGVVACEGTVRRCGVRTSWVGGDRDSPALGYCFSSPVGQISSGTVWEVQVSLW